MGTRKKSELVSEEQRNARMSAEGWVVWPWDVGRGDRLVSEALEGAWEVAATAVGASHVRVTTRAVDGDRIVVFDTEATEIGDHFPWRMVKGWAKLAEVATVPPAKRARTRAPKPEGGTSGAELATLGEPGEWPKLDGEGLPVEVLPVVLRDPMVPPEDRDLSDLGLSPGLASDDGPEDEDGEDDDGQLAFPETLPTEDEARENVARLLKEWEAKRAEQERQTPIAKKYAGRLAKAKKAESLAYEGLVKARATLDRVVGFKAVRS